MPVSVVSVLVATWCFALVIERWRSTKPALPDPVVGVVLFAFGCGVNLWGGRLTFLPAVMFGALALLLLQRQRPWMMAACAALCGLSSPLGALSLSVILGCSMVRPLCAATIARDRGPGGGCADRHAHRAVPRGRLVPVHRRQPPAVDGSGGWCGLVRSRRAARSLGGGQLWRRDHWRLRARVAAGRKRGAVGLAPRRSRCGAHPRAASSHDGSRNRRGQPGLERGVHLDGVHAAGSNRECCLLRHARVISRHAPATVASSKSCRRRRLPTQTRWRSGSTGLRGVGKPNSIAS